MPRREGLFVLWWASGSLFGKNHAVVHVLWGDPHRTLATAWFFRKNEPRPRPERDLTKSVFSTLWKSSRRVGPERKSTFLSFSMCSQKCFFLTIGHHETKGFSYSDDFFMKFLLFLTSWEVLGALRALLGGSWGGLGRSWVGRSWGDFGATCGAVQFSIDLLIDFGRQKGAQREAFGEPKWCQHLF